MFQKLHRKYVRFLLPCVTLVFSLYGLLSFLSFRYLLQEDFNEKVCHFTTQQADSIAGCLRMAEQNMDYYLMLNDPTSESFNTVNAVNSLQKVRSLTLDISLSFFMTDEAIFVNPSEYLNPMSELLRLSEEQRTPDGAFRWLYLKDRRFASDMLLCIKSVPDVRGRIFTMGVMIPVDNLLPKTNQFSNESGIFSRGHFISVIQCGEDALVTGEEVPQDADPSPAGRMNRRDQTISTAISGSPFTLSLTVSQDGLSYGFRLLLGGIFLLCLFLFLISTVTLRCFLKKLTGALEALSVRFTEFADLEQDEQGG